MRMSAYRLCYRLVLLGWLAGLMMGCRTASQPSSPPVRSTIVPPDYSRTPIIFVHGSGLNADSWRTMIQYLQDGGYPKEYLVALTLVPNDGSNSRAAKEFIAPAVESVLKQAQTVAQQAGFKGKVPQKVDFVAHSMGAVSSRWYATQMRPERVRTWISVAGANYGSKSICPYPSDGNNEICTTFKTSLQIDLLRKLNGTASQPTDPTPYGLGQDKAGIPRVPPTSSRSIFYLTIRIDPDPWITPAENAMIEGAGGLPLKLPTELPFKETSPGNYLLTENGDHDGLPQHPEVLRLVEIMLAARN